MTTAHPGLTTSWATAHRALLLLLTVAIAVVAGGITWAVLALTSPSAESAAPDLPRLEQVTDTCSGALPGAAC
jgi:hypothetical protein